MIASIFKQKKSRAESQDPPATTSDSEPQISSKKTTKTKEKERQKKKKKKPAHATTSDSSAPSDSDSHFQPSSPLSPRFVSCCTSSVLDFLNFFIFLFLFGLDRRPSFIPSCC
jgi:hypothetical protein